MISLRALLFGRALIFLVSPFLISGHHAALIMALLTWLDFRKMFITCTKVNGRGNPFYISSRIGIGRRENWLTCGRTTTMLMKLSCFSMENHLEKKESKAIHCM